MGKKKQSNANECKSKVVNFYGTKTDWIKAELNLRMCDIFKGATKEKAVVAEDDQGLYITDKSFVGAPLLDPYRMYRREVPSLNENGEYVVKTLLD